MKKGLYILLALFILLYASGCGADEAAGASSSGLPVIETEDMTAVLADISADASSDPSLLGYCIRPGYLADLNGDGMYELYANLSLGSGIVNDLVQCYDPATDQTSMLNERTITDYYVTEYEKGLYVIARSYGEGDTTVYRAALIDGKLSCEDIDAALQEKVLKVWAN